MRILAIIIALIIPFGVVRAAGFAPYVSFARQFGDVYRFTRTGMISEWHGEPPFLVHGSQFEAGITSESHSYYIAYCFFVSSSIFSQASGGIYTGYDYYSYYEKSERTWMEKQIAAGGRWYLYSRRGLRVQPTVGLAVTLSQSRLMTDIRNEYRFDFESRACIFRQRESHWSDIFPGIRTEFGFLIHAVKSVDVTMLSQLHCFWTELPGDFGTKNDYFGVAPSLHVGILYSFK